MSELIKNFSNDSSLQGYWKLDQSWSDSSLNGYNLTPVNSPTFVTGKYGQGAEFVRANSQYTFLPLGSVTNLRIAGSQTWACWVKQNSISSYQYLMSLANADGSAAAYLITSADAPNKVYFTLPGLTTNQTVDTGAGAGIQVGQWYHVAGVYDSVAGKLRIYLNGVKAGEVSASGSRVDISSGGFSIGANAGAFSAASAALGTFLDGVIDDAAIFNRALSDAEISQLYVDTGITIDNKKDLGVNDAGLQLTTEFTTSGSNRFLVVGVVGSTGAQTDMGGVSYGNVPMNLEASVQIPSDRWLYLYTLRNPPLGSNNIVILENAGNHIVGMAISYNGVRQDIGVEAAVTNVASNATSLSISATSLSNNDWATMLFASEGVTTLSPQVGTSIQQASGTFPVYALADSNRPIATAGSFTGGMNYSNTVNAAMIMILFAPTTGSSPSASMSPSSSVSSSVSPSVSPSASISPSASMSPSASLSPSAAPLPFLQRLNGQIVANGKRFRYMGVNHYPLLVSMMSKADVQTFFDACQSAGITIVRTWCFDAGKPPTNADGNFRYLVYPVGTNLITAGDNGDFEANITDIVFNGTDFSLSTDTAAPGGGTHSIKQVSSGGFSSFGIPCTVTANTDYILTYWHKTTNLGGPFPDIVFVGTTLGDNSIRDGGFIGDTGGNWQQDQISFNSGANTSIVITFGNFSGNVDAYFDKVNISIQNQDGPNLITNGDFETDLSGYSFDSDFTRSNDFAQSGSWSLKEVSTSGFQNFTTLNDANGIDIAPNTLYRFSFYVKLQTLSGSNTPIVYVNSQNAFGTTIVSQVLSPSASFQKVTLEFDSGSAEKVWIRISTNNSNVIAYYDLFSLVKVYVPILTYREAQFKQLDMILDEASKRGIRLQLSFADNTTNFDTKSTYVSWANTLWNQGLSNSFPNLDFFTNKYCIGFFQDFLHTILTRQNTINGRIYSQDATIGILELGNELRTDTFEGATVNTLQSTNLAILSNPGGWIDIMSTYIKSIDPNHLVSFGDSAHTWQWVNGDTVSNGTFYGVDYGIIAALPNIDIVDYHTYPTQQDGVHLQEYGQRLGFPNAVSGDGYRAQLRDFVDVPKALGKIATISEVGFPREEIADNTYFPLYPRINAFKEITEVFFTEGGDGICIWHGEDGDGGSYTVNVSGTWDGTTTNLNFDDRPVAAFILQVNTFAISASPSPSASMSPSTSISPSSSQSVSASPSSSSSYSPSASQSPSPSLLYSDYTRQTVALLPGDDSDLAVPYSLDEIQRISSQTDTAVTQQGNLGLTEYMVHQFKTFVGKVNACKVTFSGSSTLSPYSSPVVLQIYNRNTGQWDSLTSDMKTPSESEFTLEAKVRDLTNYKKNQTITCRIYQQTI